jgi:hypothetical protein
VAALAKNVGKPVIGPSQSNALVRARAGKGLRAQESRSVEYTANALHGRYRRPVDLMCGADALEIQ